MNVLMVGQDDSMFPEGKKAGNTIERMMRYLKCLQEVNPESSITSLVFTPRKTNPYSPSNNLLFIPVCAPRIQLFPVFGFIQVLRERKLLDPDIITTQTSFEAGLLGVLIKKVFGASLEVQIHTNFFSRYWLLEHQWWNRIRLLMTRFVLSQADTTRVVSTIIQDNLKNRLNIPESKISVIPVPVFFKREHEDENITQIDELLYQNSRVVLFVGRLCYAKNLPGLFHVIETIVNTRSDVKFILVGDGPERKFVEENAVNFDGNRIQVMGDVPYNQLTQYYQLADVIILPSFFEGFGRVILEGYLFKTPSVTTRCGGPEDIILDEVTGFLTEIDNMEEFAEKVLWLLDHPKRAAIMGRKGFDYVTQKFDPERLIRNMVEVWRSISNVRDHNP